METRLTRRRFLSLTTASFVLPAWTGGISTVGMDEIPKSVLPPGVPSGATAIISQTLRRSPTLLNTDWFGTTLLHGLLLWSKRGVSGVKLFARAWLDHHRKAQTVSKFSGPSSRVFFANGVPITTYAGHYGLAFPCYEMARQFHDSNARRVCIDVAKIILHKAARNHMGLVNHDDKATFAIPDTCYFVVTPLMIASVLDRERGEVYREQAVFQLRAYIDTFLTKDIGLAKTILLPSGLGKTYWTRASGWLLWAITGVLRHLPPADPHYNGFISDLKQLAAGIARVQDASGGLRVYLDDPTSPLETTGTAMCAIGLHEAVRRGWLPRSYLQTSLRAWEFVKGNITRDGRVVHAYTGWAVPAEQGVKSMDEHKMEWIPGLILYAADELTRPPGNP